MAAFSLSPGLEVIVLFGGSTNDPGDWNEDSFIGDTILLQFSEYLQASTQGL